MVLIRPRNLIIPDRSLTYLNLGGVVLPVVQEQVREASGLWGVLAQAGSVWVYRLERIQVPFPPVAECMGIHLHLLFCLWEGLSNLIVPICLEKKKKTTIYHLLCIICMLSNREEKYSASRKKRKLTHNSEICLTVISLSWYEYLRVECNARTHRGKSWQRLMCTSRESLKQLCSPKVMHFYSLPCPSFTHTLHKHSLVVLRKQTTIQTKEWN